ncbi:MAG: hypothetical protein LIP16_20145 [Clostridium sp.]|nr:hypothetical protein [Clostridium sp.]
MLMKESTIKQGQKEGTVVGTWIQTDNAAACEVAGYIGMNFVILDMEHGNFGPDACLNMIRACEASGIDAIVRVPNGNLQYTKNALDWGAVGVLVPSLKTAEEVREFVAQARFDGDNGGMRGGCPWIRCNHYNQMSYYGDYVKWCNENRQMWMLVENIDAVNNIEEIAQSGIDVFIMGPFDLCNSMGLEGNVTHPDVVKATERVIEAANKYGVEVCATMFSSDAEELRAEAEEWKKKGVRFFTNPSPEAILSGAYGTFRKSCRGE